MEYDRCLDICDICASTCRLRDMRKVSLSYFNRSFNSQISADYVSAHIRGERFKIIYIVDMGAKYGEREIARTRIVKKL